MKYQTALLAAATLFATPGLAQDNATATAPAEATTAAAQTSGTIAPPPAGKGQVVFYRGATIIGAAISCAVHENGAKLSSLPRGRYVAVPADPGIHSYSVKSEATDTLRLEIEPGETYFVQCSIGMGFMAGRPNLSPSDQAAFTAVSSKLKPVETN